MTQDELAVREVIATWMEATKRGDIRRVLGLMTDDVQFFVAGKPPMDKAAFEAASQPQVSANMKIDAQSEIKEVCVEGNLAYALAHLTMAVTVSGSPDPIRRAGHALTVFKKVDGQWLLHRDANLLVRVQACRDA